MTALARILLALLFLLPALARAQVVSTQGVTSAIQPGTDLSAGNVTDSGSVATNALATWMSYLTGTSNPNPILFGGNVSFAGTVPVISSCGTSPTVDSHATNNSGTVTVGTGTATSCTITFAAAYVTWNHCRVTSQSSEAVFAYSYTKSAITVTATSLVSDLIDYQCDGK